MSVKNKRLEISEEKGKRKCKDVTKGENLFKNERLDKSSVKL